MKLIKIKFTIEDLLVPGKKGEEPTPVAAVSGSLHLDMGEKKPKVINFMSSLAQMEDFRKVVEEISKEALALEKLEADKEFMSMFTRIKPKKVRHTKPKKRKK